MMFIMVIVTIILLLAVNEYREIKDRIKAEDVSKVIKEMIDKNERISVLKREKVYSYEEKLYLTKGLEIAWSYEKCKTYTKLVEKYNELEKEIERKRFERICVELANDRRFREKKERVNIELKKSLRRKIDKLKEDYPDIYNNCFSDESEVEEYIEWLISRV